MPKKIKIISIVEMAAAIIGLLFYFVLPDMLPYIIASSFNTPGASVLAGIQLLIGILMFLEWKYAAPMECVYSLLRTTASVSLLFYGAYVMGAVIVLWGIWVLYLFIFNQEIRTYTGIPALENT